MGDDQQIPSTEPDPLEEHYITVSVYSSISQSFKYNDAKQANSIVRQNVSYMPFSGQELVPRVNGDNF